MICSWAPDWRDDLSGENHVSVYATNWFPDPTVIITPFREIPSFAQGIFMRTCQDFPPLIACNRVKVAIISSRFLSTHSPIFENSSPTLDPRDLPILPLPTRLILSTYPTQALRTFIFNSFPLFSPLDFWYYFYPSIPAEWLAGLPSCGWIRAPHWLCWSTMKIVECKWSWVFCRPFLKLAVSIISVRVVLCSQWHSKV